MGRNVGLFYNRSLVGADEVVEMMLTIYSQQVFSWSVLPSSWAQGLSRSTSALSAARRVAAVLSSDEPRLLDTDALVSMIPMEIVAGAVYPKYDLLSGVTYWESSRRYVLADGSLYVMVLPQFQASWSLNLSGSAVAGIMLTYRVVDSEFEPDPIVETSYNAPYIHLNSGLSVHVPLDWSNTWKGYAERLETWSGGYWHIVGTSVRTSYLWTYPAVVDPWDMRLLMSDEHLHAVESFWELEIVDDIESGEWGFSFMPPPNVLGTRRRTAGSPNYYIDEINVLESPLPVRLVPPNMQQFGGGSRIVPLLALFFPHGARGGIGGQVAKSSDMRALSIADKLLVVNGFFLTVRE